MGSEMCIRDSNYTLEITVKGTPDPKTGFIIDLVQLKDIVNEHIINVLDHSQIEKDISWFKDKQPSSENLVAFIWESLIENIEGAQLHRVRLIETPTIKTDYYGPDCC